jgi:hypothetical protein
MRGQFSAVYVKSDPAIDRQVVKIRVGKRLQALQFSSEPSRRSAARANLVAAVAAVTAIILTVGATGAAVAERRRADASLAQLRVSAARELKAQRRVTELREDAAKLRAVTGDRAAVSEVVEALTDASRDRSESAQVEGFHWRAEGAALEVRGEDDPFVHPKAKRISEPLRPGVYLWVLSKPSRASGGAK